VEKKRIKVQKIQAPDIKKKKNLFLPVALVILILCGTVFLLMLLFPGIFGRGGGVQRTSVLPPGSAPAITSATIVPENPTTAAPLSANYDGQGPEGAALSYRFRWYVNDAVVQDGTSAILDPGNYKKGNRVKLEVIPSDGSQTGKPYETPEVVIGNRAPVISLVTLVPVDAPVNTLVTAEVTGEDPDGDPVSYTYQWGLNGKYVTEPQTENTFNTTGLHKKDKLYVTVTPSDGESTGDPTASDISILSNSAPKITSSPNYTIANGIYTYQVTAVDPDGDPVTYNLEKSPANMTIDRTTGLIQWEVPKQISEKQEIVIKIKAEDGDGGVTDQEYSLILNMQ
jgi:Putative Ig domain